MGGKSRGAVAEELPGSRSRRGPALPFKDEGPNRGEPMHARAARDREKKGERGMEGMDGGNGIQLTFLHSGELLRPQAVHTRPSCVSFRRC